ncbi:hypothetical protein EBR96_07200 [bacterium]|nr:hypothetical protein [bacterium]
MITPFLEKLILAGEAKVRYETVGYSAVNAVTVGSGKTAILTRLDILPYVSAPFTIPGDTGSYWTQFGQEIKNQRDIFMSRLGTQITLYDNTNSYAIMSMDGITLIFDSNANSLEAVPLYQGHTYDMYAAFSGSFDIAITHQAYSLIQAANVPTFPPMPATDGNGVQTPNLVVGMENQPAINFIKRSTASAIAPYSGAQTTSDRRALANYTMDDYNSGSPTPWLDAGLPNPIPFRDNATNIAGYGTAFDSMYPKINIELVEINDTKTGKGLISESLLNKYK